MTSLCSSLPTPEMAWGHFPALVNTAAFNTIEDADLGFLCEKMKAGSKDVKGIDTIAAAPHRHLVAQRTSA